MRVEVSKDSALPVSLTKFGYVPRHIGSVMRVTSDDIKNADALEIDLPRQSRRCKLSSPLWK